MKRIILLAIVMLAFACKTPVPCTSTHTETTIVRDTTIPVYLSPDSALFEALLECDSSGNVLLTSLNSEVTKRLMAEFTLQQNKLSYKVRTVIDTLYITQKHYYKETIRVQTPPVPTEPETPWWANFVAFSNLFILVFLVIKVGFRFFVRKLPS